MICKKSGTRYLIWKVGERFECYLASQCTLLRQTEDEPDGDFQESALYEYFKTKNESEWVCSKEDLNQLSRTVKKSPKSRKKTKKTEKKQKKPKKANEVSHTKKANSDSDHEPSKKSKLETPNETHPDSSSVTIEKALEMWQQFSIPFLHTIETFSQNSKSNGVNK